MVLEGVHRLVHQRYAVGQKQHTLGPVAAHQQVGERNYRARLAGAGGHHHQRLAVVVALEGLGDAPDAARLVIALDDGRADLAFRQRLARGAALDRELQLRLLVEALHRARRVAGVVPEPVLVAVGIEDQRALAELALQAVRIELGLLLTDAGIAPGAFGLDQSQRLAVVAPQHVVDEADALLVGHPGDLELAVPRLVERPAGLLEQQVDEVVAGLGLGVVVRVWLGLCGLPHGGHLGPRALHLLVERGLVGEQRCKVLVLLAQARFQRLQPLGRLRRHPSRSRQRGCIESEVRSRPPHAPVAAREPVGDVEQLTHRRQRVRLRYRAQAVHRAITQRIDHPRLAEHRLARGLLEARFVDQRRQVVLVREPQPCVVLVGPVHRQFERAASVETGGTRVRMHRGFRLGSGIVNRRPFALEEVELTHLCTSSSAASSSTYWP